VAEFFGRAIETGAVEPGTAGPTSVWFFGDSAELADELLDLVLHGPKRATAATVAEYELEGEPLPQVGDLSVVTDFGGQPRALLRTTDVRVGPLSSVDEAFAWDEGEGDRTREGWLRDHTTYFQRALPPLGLAFDPDMATVFERFEVAYSE
jgi:uncharacterized protein YhfF